MKRAKLISDILMYIVLIAVSFVVIIPILYVVFGSFKTNAEIMTNATSLWPKQFTFENYITAWSMQEFSIPRMMWNSTWYTLISVFITLVTASMAGYVFARLDFPGKKVIFAAFSSLMFITLGSITIYPLFDILAKFNLSRSLWGLMILKVFGVGIMNIYLVRGFVNTLPKEMDEAAYVDGCSFFSTFTKIIFPLLKPIMATIGILAFQSSWNDYLMPTLFTITRPDQQTLIVGIMALKNAGESAASWNLMLAGATVALIPVIIAYCIGNKYFVSGLTAGAVKG